MHLKKKEETITDDECVFLGIAEKHTKNPVRYENIPDYAHLAEISLAGCSSAEPTSVCFSNQIYKN